MTEENAPSVGEEGKLHRSASERAFELFFCLARELEGIRDEGADVLQDLLRREGEVTPVGIVSMLFPEQRGQPSEADHAEDQASENTGV